MLVRGVVVLDGMNDLAGWNNAAFLLPDERQKRSLNAGVRGRKDRGGSNLDEQVHQIRERRGIEPLHSLDELAPEILIRESFAQPVELLHGPVPVQGIGQASLVAVLLVRPARLGVGEVGGAEHRDEDLRRPAIVALAIGLDQGRADALRRAGDDCDFSLNVP